MHVVHLETGRHVYGGPRQVLLLMQGLRQRGVEGTLVCPAGSEVAREAERLGLAVRELPMRGDLDLGFADRLANLLAEIQADLLHVHSRRGADWLGGRAARRAGVLAVLTRRVDRPVRRLAARVKYRPYARLIAISRLVCRQLEEAGVPASRLQVIRSSVAPERGEAPWSRERLAREFGLEPGAQLVGCIAQLIRRKGHVELLRAWRDVAAACPRARLLLFGRGPREGRLRRLAVALGIASSVVFAGFRADLPEFLGRLDLVVHPALEEGLGLAVLEAQSAGVPVVAFRAGGVPEAVADGRTGCLVPVGDMAGLARAMIGLLQDDARRHACAEAAWVWVAREFRVADMVSAHLTLYRELIETQSP